MIMQLLGDLNTNNTVDLIFDYMLSGSKMGLFGEVTFTAIRRWPPCRISPHPCRRPGAHCRPLDPASLSVAGSETQAQIRTIAIEESPDDNQRARFLEAKWIHVASCPRPIRAGNGPDSRRMRRYVPTPSSGHALRGPAELDLRSLKTDMKMEMLRTKTPEMVRKEVAVHLLGYNLIRGIMAASAQVGGVKPRQLSYTGALHTIRSFEEVHLYDPVQIRADLPRLLELIVTKRVGDRPDRYEPRAVKRRPKPHPLLTMPRKTAKALIRRGIIIYNKA